MKKADVAKIKDAQSVKSTTNYSLFGLIDGNRPIRGIKRKDLCESMLKEGWHTECPMIVYYSKKQDKFLILDGQNRFVIAQALGIPVYFCIKDEFDDTTSKKTILEYIATMNSTSDKWKLDDYIHDFAKQGNKNYILLEKMMNKYCPKNISLTVLLATVAGHNTVGGNLVNYCKKGTYTCFSQNEEEVERAVIEMFEYQPLLKLIPGRSDGKNYGLIYILHTPNVDKEKVRKIIKRKANNGTFPPVLSTTDFLSVIESNYNTTRTPRNAWLDVIRSWEYDKKVRESKKRA